MFHWFLSFRDEDANVSLGGCKVVQLGDEANIALAAEVASTLGCNPGGEVLGFTAEGSDSEIAAAVLAMPEGVLLSREEVDWFWRPFGIVAGRPPRT